MQPSLAGGFNIGFWKQNMGQKGNISNPYKKSGLTTSQFLEIAGPSPAQEIPGFPPLQR